MWCLDTTLFRQTLRARLQAPALGKRQVPAKRNFDTSFGYVAGVTPTIRIRWLGREEAGNNIDAFRRGRVLGELAKYNHG